MNNRITTDPHILGGKPIIRGTRIPVALLLEQLAVGTTIEELLQNFSDLTREDVAAALGFAHDLVAAEDFAPAPLAFA